MVQSRQDIREPLRVSLRPGIICSDESHPLHCIHRILGPVSGLSLIESDYSLSRKRFSMKQPCLDKLLHL